jgi:hypothetical protein
MLFEHCSVIAAVCTASKAQTLQQLQCDSAYDCVLLRYIAALEISGVCSTLLQWCSLPAAALLLLYLAQHLCILAEAYMGIEPTFYSAELHLLALGNSSYLHVF